MVIAFPAAAVVAGIVMLYLAVTSHDGLVVDDYYKHGLEINRLLERERAAAAANLTMKANFDPDKRLLMVSFTARPGFGFPSRLKGVLAHATREGLDYPLRLERVGDASYRVEDIAPPAGRWYLEIGTAEWRVTKKIVTR